MGDPGTGMLLGERTARPGAATLQEWDRLVEQSPGSDLVQLSAWSEVRAAVGFTASYVFVREGERLVAGAQILHRRVPVLGSFGYLPYGPLIAPWADRERVRRVLAAELAAVARRSRMFFVQPPAGADDVSRELLARGFRRSDADIAPAATLQVDLTVDEAELCGRLSRRLRRWIRRWPERGVSVRVGGPADIEMFAQLVATTAQHQGFAPMPAEYLARMHERLAPGGNAVLLVGEVHGRPVAAELFTACGGVAGSRFCGFDRSAESARLNVASAVTWEGIRWARSHGHRVFDFGGLDPQTLESLPEGDGFAVGEIEGPDRFKAKFGGRLVRYPTAVEYVPSAVVRRLYDAARNRPAGRRVLGAARAVLRGQRRLWPWRS
ncbi:MAG TPA: GNAT family N-acetyltransferase [Pseudonocardia sp.]|nr:GNAT family N-acetyltransferase [Pseudonocardia sp.]